MSLFARLKSWRATDYSRASSQPGRREEPLSREAAALAAAALNIIDSQVQFLGPGLLSVASSGSGGQVMDAARKLEEAHRLHPEDALLHYAWASALQLAMQNRTAREEMERLAQSAPHFPLARYAVAGWEHGKSHFFLPPWQPGSRQVHPAISAAVLASTLLAVRDGLTPRCALFFRDTGRDLDIRALPSARLDLATVINAATEPQVVGVYARIWDNPRDPMRIEALGLPLHVRGDEIRLRYELLCLQEDLDFVVLGQGNEVLLSRRVPLSAGMRQVHQRLRALLEASDGREISQAEMMKAVQAHQRQLSHNDVRY